MQCMEEFKVVWYTCAGIYRGADWSGNCIYGVPVAGLTIGIVQWQLYNSTKEGEFLGLLCGYSQYYFCYCLYQHLTTTGHHIDHHHTVQVA